MFVLKSKYKKLLKEKQQAEQSLQNVQNTLSKVLEKAEETRMKVESKFLEAQEKNQQFFFKKEKDLKEQVQLGIIDHKEYHYSQRLLEEAEKALK